MAPSLARSSLYPLFALLHCFTWLFLPVHASTLPESFFSTSLTKRATFEEFQLTPTGSLSGLGLDATCEQVLYQNVTCDDYVSSLGEKAYHNGLNDTSLANSVCDSSCGNSLKTMQRRVAGACANTPEMLPGYPVLALVDSIYTGWNETCIKDNATESFCNGKFLPLYIAFDIIDSWTPVDDITEMPKEQLCSYCYGAKLIMMQQSPYSAYDENYADRLQYLASNPADGGINVNGTDPATCISGNTYITTSEDTCDSIAVANQVSSATLYYINPSLLTCEGPGEGLTLCLPAACETLYTVQPNDNCSSIAASELISWRDIVSWNAGLDSMCTNIVDSSPSWGSVICVSPPGGSFTEAPGNGNSTGNGDTGGPGGSGDGYSDTVTSAPSGTIAEGTISSCGEYVQAHSGDSCSKMILDEAVPMSLFVEINPSLESAALCSSNLNPGVKDDCSGLQIGNSYCVEVNFGVPQPTSTHAPTTTSASSEPTEPAKPSPTQDGLIDTCTSFYLAAKGDTCDTIINMYGTFTFTEFYAWNPAVDEDCSGLWASTYYCVGVPSTPTVKPSATTSAPTATPTGPSPVQEGVVDTCTTFYKAVSGDSCTAIVNRYGTFSMADFTTWNPAVGEDCSGLWLGYYYCVGVPGTPTAKPTTTQTSAMPTATGPSPTQDGIISTCTRYYKAVSGDSCSKIASSYGTFSLDDFLSWNPAVGQDCSGLWLGYYYCIAWCRLSVS
ncbi:hypothetical protein SLS58_006463 [Diplodia intermedia]|uniref:LysM domain-containing protein n=1 Tax=Diplodia intermedia TaxID=856260 RepID=A0ABR3TN50_9PEZI